VGIIAKVDIEGELTKGKAYSIGSAVYQGMVRVVNNENCEKLYSLSCFESLGK
jgi:hypothetical protein